MDMGGGGEQGGTTTTAATISNNAIHSTPIIPEREPEELIANSFPLNDYLEG